MTFGTNLRQHCPDTVDCHDCQTAIVVSERNELRCSACQVPLCEECWDGHLYSDPCFAKIRPAALRIGNRKEVRQ